MVASDEEDDTLAQFLESEILSESFKEEEKQTSPPSKKLRFCDNNDEKKDEKKVKGKGKSVKFHVDLFHSSDSKVPKLIESGNFSNFPPELFHHVLKFLSPEDLVTCSLVCRFLNYAASNECLWRRLYCMRWGMESSISKLRNCSWKKLYIQRDEKDMIYFVKNTPSEFKEYYIQMQAAKRSHAPILSQALDDHIILDTTLADQVSSWKSSQGLTDDLALNHVCCGYTCSYRPFGNLFVCEKTGLVHVCGDTCKEVDLDMDSGLFVCRFSGQCFDTFLSAEEIDPELSGVGVQEVGLVMDDGEPDLGFGRFARAYQLGYDCDDEKELEDVMRDQLYGISCIAQQLDFGDQLCLWSVDCVHQQFGVFGDHRLWTWRSLSFLLRSLSSLKTLKSQQMDHPIVELDNDNDINIDLDGDDMEMEGVDGPLSEVRTEDESIGTLARKPGDSNVDDVVESAIEELGEELSLLDVGQNVHGVASDDVEESPESASNGDNGPSGSGV
ncbi:hypothetical protein GIB67_012497 [Kingdonia uniflora]|uniref:F-box domain-containing protein n=1 Tax=Kingdonia uniflora TaxID=39325 RepID=A0A7J7MVJ1_9MAGN|nr:hypothetical protein GIB67_012497 [Kingdonia uniflora]